MIRQRLAAYHTKIQILRINGLRTLAAQFAGRDGSGSQGALGATNKMFWSEMHQEAMELALDLYGAEAMLMDTGPAIAARGPGRCVPNAGPATPCRR